MFTEGKRAGITVGLEAIIYIILLVVLAIVARNIITTITQRGLS